jgi:hypothetical protein
MTPRPVLAAQCVRSEEPGKFANELFTGALTAMLCSDAFNADLLGARAQAAFACVCTTCCNVRGLRLH